MPLPQIQSFDKTRRHDRPIAQDSRGTQLVRGGRYFDLRGPELCRLDDFFERTSRALSAAEISSERLHSRASAMRLSESIVGLRTPRSMPEM